MMKTNEHNVSFNDLTVDTAGLQALTHAGIKTATRFVECSKNQKISGRNF